MTQKILANKSVFLKWILSYVLIMMIPVSAMLMSYAGVDHVVRTEITDSNAAMVGVISKSLDERLSEARKLSFRIGTYPMIGALRLKDGEDDPATWYELGLFANNLNIYATSTSFSESLYVLTHKSNIAFSVTGSTTYEMIYNRFHAVEGFSYYDWLSAVRESEGFTFMPVLREGINSGASIAFIAEVPTSARYATVVVLLNFDEGKFLFQPDGRDNTGREVFIIDEHDNIISPTGSEIKINGWKYDDLAGEQGVIHRDKLVVSYASSQVANVKYVVTVPEDIFFQRIKSIRISIIVFLVFSLAVGLAMAYLFSKKQYSPLREIMLLVSKQEKTKEDGNEYFALRNNLQKLMEERDRILFDYEKHNDALRTDFLSNLVKGLLEEKELEKPLIEVISEKFAVIALHIDDIRQVFDGESKAPTQKDVKLVYLVIKNVLEELAGKRHKGYVFNLDDMCFCLVNFADSVSVSQAYDDMEGILKDFNKVLNECFYIFLTVSVGEIVNNLRQVSYSFKTAVDAMKYRIINNKGEIIFYSRLDSSKDENIIVSSLSQENRLVNYIKIADYKKAQELMEEIFSEILRSSPSINTAKYLIYYITNLAVKAFSQSNMSEIAHRELNIAERLLGCDTLLDLKQEINAVFEEAAGSANVSTDEKTELTEKIIKYVKDNYSNQDLNVAMIGYKFHKNSSYISRIIKERTGDSLHDYINKYRVAQAKILLKNNNMQINEVAERVGFNNSVGLIRVFKKYEGVTPGDFRKIDN